ADPPDWGVRMARRGEGGGMLMRRIVAALTRWLVAVSLAVIGCLTWPRDLGAAGFLLNEQSGRGLGSAFAGEGALAMDPTTVYYNPAGMVLVPGTQFGSSGC